MSALFKHSLLDVDIRDFLGDRKIKYFQETKITTFIFQALVVTSPWINCRLHPVAELSSVTESQFCGSVLDF